MLNRNTVMRWVAIGAVIIAMACYYLWQLRAGGDRFDWVHQQNGYYNYLGRAFAHGHLYLPLEPSPQLLAASNPWDKSVDENAKMHDMVYFNKRYYLYHGAGPAVLLFTPWILLTGHDMPERFAMFLLCFGGFLFSCGVLLRWLNIAEATPPLPLLTLLLLALGMCTCVPYLLNRVAVYEIAIAGGYFFISGALLFLTLGVESKESPGCAWWLTASGLFFGGAIASRPHLGLAGAIALAALAFLLARSRRRLAGFVLAFGLVGALVALYNYERFGRPFEFGVQYLLTGPEPIGIKLAWANLVPGFYFWLICPPDFSGVFPWIRLAFRYPFNSLSYPFPHLYFIEAITGALFPAPFVIAALFLPFARRAVLLWTTLLSSAAVFLFLNATGFTTQRYEVDFLPMALLVALASFCIWIHRTRGIPRALLRIALIVSIACGVVVNLALGILGPYSNMLRTRPITYVRIARWFSPNEYYRPILNPTVAVSFAADFISQPDRYREPLLLLPNQPFRYVLFAEHCPGGMRFTSFLNDFPIVTDAECHEGMRADVRVTYDPDAHQLSAIVNGRELAVHNLPALVLAPAEVTIGENTVEPGLTNERFTGQIHDVVESVRPGR